MIVINFAACNCMVHIRFKISICTDLGIVYDHLKRIKKVESRIEAERKAFGDREERVSFLRGSARVVTFAIIRCSD